MAPAQPPSAARAARSTHRIGRAQLLPLLPATLSGWTRDSLHSDTPQPRGTPSSTLRAEYRREGARATLSILEGKLLPDVAWPGGPVDRDTATGHEKVTRAGGRVVREETRRTPAQQSVSFILANGLVVTALSPTADTASLRALIEAIELDQAEALKPAR